MRKLTPGVAAKPLHAFPVKSVKANPRRRYGEHPYLTWSQDDPVARISYWSEKEGTASIAIKDENGNLWKELPAVSRRGMNQIEYDLSADPKLADAAEAARRGKALADPLRATRKRSLPPGKYTIEVQSGGAKETTTLIVKPEKEGAGEVEEPAETR